MKDRPSFMAQKTISIDQELHARAVKHAKTVHYTDFSGLVTKLILADIQGSEAAAL